MGSPLHTPAIPDHSPHIQKGCSTPHPTNSQTNSKALPRNITSNHRSSNRSLRSLPRFRGHPPHPSSNLNARIPISSGRSSNSDPASSSVRSDVSPSGVSSLAFHINLRPRPAAFLSGTSRPRDRPMTLATSRRPHLPALIQSLCVRISPPLNDSSSPSLSSRLQSLTKQSRPTIYFSSSTSPRSLMLHLRLPCRTPSCFHPPRSQPNSLRPLPLAFLSQLHSPRTLLVTPPASNHSSFLQLSFSPAQTPLVSPISSLPPHYHLLPPLLTISIQSLSLQQLSLFTLHIDFSDTSSVSCLVNLSPLHPSRASLPAQLP
uniref:Uncharacterized protein n=1 Tax=Knipowitschia caucasica TaxID=637954 RepID=A0AAV2IXX6_KNICA